MPFFHVTFDRHIPSILKHGLGGRIVEQNYPGCEPGVYLATDHDWGIAVLMEAALKNAPDDMKPAEWIASLRIIVIDDSRIVPRLLTDDESFPGAEHIRLYKGVIDVTNMPILDIDAVTPAEFRPGGEEYERIAAAIA